MFQCLFSAGSNARGQLSNGSTEDSHNFHPCSFLGYSPGNLPPQTRRVLHVTSGANHTIVVLEMCDDHGELQLELWGCGDGSSGQLGAAYRQTIESGESPAIFRPISLSLEQENLEGYLPKLVSASWETTYIVLSSAKNRDVLISMGGNDFGDLGVGGLGERKGKSSETKSFQVVDFSNLAIDGLSLGSSELIFQSLDAGQHHVVTRVQVVLSDGHSGTYMMGWGASRHGQLGEVPAKAGRPLSYFSTPNIIFTHDSKDPIRSTALGNQHTVFLHASGKVSYLGSNRKGQLQGLESARRAMKLGCTWNGTYVLVQEDPRTTRILATGSHIHGQLGRKLTDPTDLSTLGPVEWVLPSISNRVINIVCGAEHVLALVWVESKSSGEVWGWGWNEHGNLGTGRTDDVFIPTRIWPAELKDGAQSCQNVAAIWAGCGTSWIYSTKG